MAFDGFDEADYENMRRPGSKMVLTQMNGLSNIVSVVSYDDQSQHVTVKYERNKFMKQDLLDRLREDEFAIDLRTYIHQWIDTESDLYCLACQSLELDHLFVCNHESHIENVAFHDRCLDITLGHIIPNNDTARSWTCPIHSNMLQKLDPNQLRRRRGDYDFDFDRPVKKRRLNISEPNWLKLRKDQENIYPIHISCQYCHSEGISSECDGHRPCGNCMKYVQDEIMDMTQLKYISMNETEIQIEIEIKTNEYCKNRNCTFDEFENDISMRNWLKTHDNKLYQIMIQEKREKDQQQLDNDIDDYENDNDNDIDILHNDNENENKNQIKNENNNALSIKESEQLIQHKFKYKQPVFVDSVPIYARYKCDQCNELFGDKYRYNMHQLWAHNEIICSKKALASNTNWDILNHFQSNKPLKFACPYSGCLRGANNSQEIEDHILRHHDITDPTKPNKTVQNVKNKGQSKGKTVVIKNKNKNMNSDHDDVKCVGIGYLSGSEKRKLSKIWHEAKTFRIDPKNQRELIRNFVGSVVSDTLGKFDKTTKRLQKEYKQNMDRIAAVSANRNIHGHIINKSIVNNLPPPLVDDGFDDHNSTGPKSLWG